MLQRNDVEFVREELLDTPIANAVQLKVLCVHKPMKIGTIVYLNVLPEARQYFPTAQLWQNHGAFLEDRALEALNEELAARFPDTIQ